MPWRVDSPAEVAAVLRARDGLALAPAAIVVANPLPPRRAAGPRPARRVLAAGCRRPSAPAPPARTRRPFLLDFFHRETAGASLEVNIRIILRNARLAGEIAAASR